MNNDYFDYHIHIENFSALLLWLTVLCFLGIFVTGYAMSVMSRFFLTEKDKETGKVSRFSIIDFELPYSFTRFKNLLGNLSDNTKDTVRMNLKMDYKFMPFAYLFLFFWWMVYYATASFIFCKRRLLQNFIFPFYCMGDGYPGKHARPGMPGKTNKNK